jgi:hypothetical protein
MPELREAGAGAVSAGATGSRRKITIIDSGWGSSGYYSRQLLEQYGPRAFPAGTHMYLDHPTRTEESDRPERSVRDLAARIATTPRMEGNALVAEADIFPVWQPTIDALADDIGLSVRAMGQTEHGDAEGRSGPIVKTLDEGLSVDFVTKAGRGGKVGQLVESARSQRDRALDEAHRIDEQALADVKAFTGLLAEARNAGHWLEAKIHQNFTEVADNLFGSGYLTREERIALSNAIGDGLTAFNESVAKNVPHLYDRDPYADPQAAGVQVHETRRSSADNQEAHMADDTRLSELEESVRKLTANVSTLEERATKAEQERDSERTRADRAEDALLETKADRIIEEALTAQPKEGDEPMPRLPERAVGRVREAAKGTKLPLDESGKLDKDALIARVRKAAKDEAEYLGEAGVSTAGRVTGMGGATLTESGTAPDDKDLTEAFQRLGMDDKTAARAAQGR